MTLPRRLWIHSGYCIEMFLANRLCLSFKRDYQILKLFGFPQRFQSNIQLLTYYNESIEM